MKSYVVPLVMLAAAGCARGAQPEPPPTRTEISSPDPNEVPPTTEVGPVTAPPADAGPTATAVLEPRSGSTVQGLAAFSAREGGVEATVTVTGATPGEHGLHIHERGDCSAADASSAGGHFAPEGKPHGPPGEGSHAGDMGNIVVDEAGAGVATVFLPDVTIEPGEPTTIAGKALVVHERADDLVSQPSGDSGGRVACGVIDTAADRPPASGPAE